MEGYSRVKIQTQNGKKKKNLCHLYIRWEINIKIYKELQKWNIPKAKSCYQQWLTRVKRQLLEEEIKTIIDIFKTQHP